MKQNKRGSPFMKFHQTIKCVYKEGLSAEEGETGVKIRGKAGSRGWIHKKKNFTGNHKGLAVTRTSIFNIPLYDPTESR